MGTELDIGGWNSDGTFPDDFDAEVDQAYSNVNIALQNAGSKGWEQVYSTRKFVRSLETPTLDAIGRNLAKWTPGQDPLMSIYQVQLWENMAIEIEVEAYVPVKDSLPTRKSV